MENEHTVFVKEKFVWHFASMYLDFLRSTAVINDEEFMRLYDKLCDYVDSKVFIPCAGEFADFGVYVERKIILYSEEISPKIKIQS